MSKAAVFLVLTVMLRGCGIPLQTPPAEPTTTALVQQITIAESEQTVLLP